MKFLFKTRYSLFFSTVFAVVFSNTIGAHGFSWEMLSVYTGLTFLFGFIDALFRHCFIKELQP
ncbi:hypothetical protein ACRZYO_003795 [Pseudomonas aeruginosa]|uniref:hypothetical protein n=1 Tax=Pseudomonas aeruginosa TaxID=287 RepID=UPI0018C575EA|nr:hypothetical protein [Pseudomonas aeruginosa]HBO2161993.1 hypothetical protein [Pseudomonas aeruginosa]HBP6284484.1 hypothetical protein [Pseudomonas aeruginosa]